MKQEYDALMTAAKDLARIERILSDEDGPLVSSPAWRKVNHAKAYVVTMAENLLKEEIAPCQA